jgi:hypothetical protein
MDTKVRWHSQVWTTFQCHDGLTFCYCLPQSSEDDEVLTLCLHLSLDLLGSILLMMLTVSFPFCGIIQLQELQSSGPIVWLLKTLILEANSVHANEHSYKCFTLCLTILIWIGSAPIGLCSTWQLYRFCFGLHANSPIKLWSGPSGDRIHLQWQLNPGHRSQPLCSFIRSSICLQIVVVLAHNEKDKGRET